MAKPAVMLAMVVALVLVAMVSDMSVVEVNSHGMPTLAQVWRLDDCFLH